MEKVELLKDPVLGAIIGDIVGSRFEFSDEKIQDFEFFDECCEYTDDTVMTLAVAKAIIECNGDYDNLSSLAIKNMVQLGKKYLECGFGKSFLNWINSDAHEPYNSYGNGAAMRISSCGVVAQSENEVKLISDKVTSISHNHPDGIRGAESVAMMIYKMKKNIGKQELKEIFMNDYYDINFTVENLKNSYGNEISCSKTVPQAFECFFESTNFEEAIRNAISIGGDSDTIAAICGSMAAMYYGIPIDFKEKAISYLNSDLLKIYNSYETKILKKL